MNVGTMIRKLERYIDDTFSPQDAVDMLNAGQNKMAVETGCKFPELTLTDSGSTFVFDEKYHETPILYAAAMMKASDSSLQEKESFMVQFLDGLADFTENYDPPMRYRDTIDVQQFTAQAGQTLFTITKRDYDPIYGNLSVFVNDGKRTDFDKDENTFTLLTATASGDAVTAKWEIRPEWTTRPAFYPGW